MESSFLNLEALIREAGLDVPNVAATQAVAVAVPAPRKKFLLVGTHAHQTTGYSKVTYNIIKELAKHPDLELYHFGFQKFMTPPPNYRNYPHGVDVYDPVALEKANLAPQEMGFGFSQLADYVRKVKPNVIMIYNDAVLFVNSLTNWKKSCLRLNVLPTNF